MKEIELNTRQTDTERFDSLPLWEIDATAEDPRNIKTTAVNMFAEGLRENNSSWLLTIDKLNEHYYARKGRAKSSQYGLRAVMKWTADIEKEVDRLVVKGKIDQNDRDYTVEQLEKYASNKINAKLTSAKQNKLNDWREKGAGKLLKNILTDDVKFRPVKRNVSSLRNFVERESSLILEQKPTEIEVVNTDKIPQKQIVVHNETPKKDRNIFPYVAVPVGVSIGLGLVYLASKESEGKKIKLPSAQTPVPLSTPSPVVIEPAKTINPKDFSNIVPKTAGRVAFSFEVKSTIMPEVNNMFHNKLFPVSEVKDLFPTPEPDYYHSGIDFSNKNESTIEIAGVSASSIPLVHWESFNAQELAKYNQDVASGTGNSYVSTDIYGNTIWGDHSGTNRDGKDNPAEQLRIMIQGGGVRNVSTYLSEDEVYTNVEKLKGQIVTIRQKDGSMRTFKIVASGIIPNGKLNDKFNNDTKSVTDTTIEATGGKESDFNTLTSERGILYHICLHGVSPDPNKPGYVLINQKFETLVIGLIPTDDAKLQNETEMAKQKNNENQNPLEKSARSLSQIINMASSRVKDYGEKFKKFTLEQLRLFGVTANREIVSVVDKIAQETSDGSKIDSSLGANLLGAMPGSEGVVADNDPVIDPDIKSIPGAVINKINSANDIKIGDKIYIPKSPLFPEGHYLVVIDSWTDRSGKIHFQIFDVDYNNFGLARILEDVTQDNIYDQIAKGQKTSLYLIRPEKKSNQLASNTN